MNIVNIKRNFKKKGLLIQYSLILILNLENNVKIEHKNALVHSKIFLLNNKSIKIIISLLNVIVEIILKSFSIKDKIIKHNEWNSIDKGLIINKLKIKSEKMIDSEINLILSKFNVINWEIKVKAFKNILISKENILQII